MTKPQSGTTYRSRRILTPTLENWKPLGKKDRARLRKNVVMDCGWGRLLFAHTFESPEKLVQELQKEETGQRDIAFYVKDPHVALNYAPTEVFLDPSHTYRLWFEKYRPSKLLVQTLNVRRITNKKDLKAANEVLASRGMVPFEGIPPWDQKDPRAFTLLIAEDFETGEAVGFV
ncbi:MAG: hypothetical protein KDD22_08470, partial [Bdellovibrionales bacterium]|nr:hypothetical protein [Bdellovibrionales bacterium]